MIDSNKYNFYTIFAQSTEGYFDIYVNETNDLELAVALARRYTDTHDVATKIEFNDNKAAIIVTRGGK